MVSNVCAGHVQLVILDVTFASEEKVLEMVRRGWGEMMMITIIIATIIGE